MSGGQQQRVALARALVFEPKLVLMDEPLGALDKQLRETMQYEIKHLHDRLGLTVVYVTHDQGEALTMSDRVAVFNAGRIQQLATPDQLYERAEQRVRGAVHRREQPAARPGPLGGGQRCAVEVEGAAVHALAVNVGGPGSPTTLSLRPERVALGCVRQRLPEPVPGSRQELIYHGDHIRTRVNLLGHDDFIVKVPNRAGHAALRPGDDVTVAWLAEDCRALDLQRA